MADEKTAKEKTGEGKKNQLDPAKQVISQGLFIIIMFLIAIILFYVIATKP